MKKDFKKAIGTEPTISDVMGAVQGFAGQIAALDQKMSGRMDTLEGSIHDLAVQTGFANVEGRLDKVEVRLDGVENRLGEVEYRMTAVKKRTGALEDTLEDMKDTLDGVARAIDKDAVTIINHERRVGRLEKVCAA